LDELGPSASRWPGVPNIGIALHGKRDAFPGDINLDDSHGDVLVHFQAKQDRFISDDW
jgi:hypothetical protein